MTKIVETCSTILLKTLDDWGDMGTDNIRDRIEVAAKLAKQMEKMIVAQAGHPDGRPKDWTLPVA